MCEIVKQLTGEHGRTDMSSFLSCFATKKQSEKSEKENDQSEIQRAFEEDSKQLYSVNKDCGLNNKSQKCGRCNFITHSMGRLRMHEKKEQKVYNNFDKVVDGYKFDDRKYFDVLAAMYEGDELQNLVLVNFML